MMRFPYNYKLQIYKKFLIRRRREKKEDLHSANSGNSPAIDLRQRSQNSFNSPFCKISIFLFRILVISNW